MKPNSNDFTFLLVTFIHIMKKGREKKKDAKWQKTFTHLALKVISTLCVDNFCAEYEKTIYTMVYLSVCGDNPRVLASGMSTYRRHMFWPVECPRTGGQTFDYYLNPSSV